MIEFNNKEIGLDINTGVYHLKLGNGGTLKLVAEMSMDFAVKDLQEQLDTEKEINKRLINEQARPKNNP